MPSSLMYGQLAHQAYHAFVAPGFSCMKDIYSFNQKSMSPVDN